MTTSPKLPTEAMIEAAMVSYYYHDPDAATDDDRTDMIAAITAALAVAPRDERSCTCHPDDNPPQPCPKKYALSECRSAADDAFNAGLEMGARVADHAGSWRIATAIRASKRDRAEARADIAIRERDAARDALREMREALEPFAAIADWFDSFDRLSPDSDLLAYGDEETHLRVGDFRRARSALASSGAAREEETDV